MFDLSCYFIIGRSSENTHDNKLFNIIDNAICGGITFLQYRSPLSNFNTQINDCLKISKIIKKHKEKNENITFVINDRLDILLSSKYYNLNLDGIHLGQNDIDVNVTRKILEQNNFKNAIIGLSVQNAHDIRKANKNKNIDYVGLSPVNHSSTKPECNNGKGLGIEKVNQLSNITKHPIVVGGGVLLNDIEKLAKCENINGVFMSSLITKSKDTKKRTKTIINKWSRNRFK